MNQSDNHHHVCRDAVLTLAAVGVILALLRMSASIVEPVLLSLLIVAVVSPGLRVLRRLGLSTGLSVFVGLIVVVLVLGAFSIILSGALAQFVDKLPKYQAILADKSVLLSLVFWGWMFGIVGMLVSVPLSMAVRAFGDIYPPTRWLAIMMGPIPEELPAESGSVIEGKPES